MKGGRVKSSAIDGASNRMGHICRFFLLNRRFSRLSRVDHGVDGVDE
jgi:hypothetical protein